MNEVKSLVRKISKSYKQLLKFGFPKNFVIIQFPNIPLIIGVLAGALSTRCSGELHEYLRAIEFVGLLIWAYTELKSGVNWFRRLLGSIFVIYVIIEIAHALNN